MEANQTRQIFAVASAFVAVLSHNRVLSPVFPLGIGVAGNRRRSRCLKSLTPATLLRALLFLF